METSYPQAGLSGCHEMSPWSSWNGTHTTGAGMGGDLQGRGTCRGTGTSRDCCGPQEVDEVHGLEIPRGSEDTQRWGTGWVRSLCHSGPVPSSMSLSSPSHMAAGVRDPWTGWEGCHSGGVPWNSPCGFWGGGHRRLCGQAGTWVYGPLGSPWPSHLACVVPSPHLSM